MKEKVSLLYIIQEVLADKNIPADPTNERALRRAFERLLERIGSDKSALKNDRNQFEFNVADVPFMKRILTQLYENKGIIAEFVNEHRQKNFSSEETHNLIQSLIDEADAEGWTETELKDMAYFLSMLFYASPKRSIEYCHKLIDCLGASLADLPYAHQGIYLNKVEHVLKHEFALRMVDSVIAMIEIADISEDTKKLQATDVVDYQEYDPIIRYEYAQRDQNILEKIQEDDDLRQYVEKKIGKKAEDIFNYANMELCKLKDSLPI